MNTNIFNSLNFNYGVHLHQQQQQQQDQKFSSGKITTTMEMHFSQIRFVAFVSYSPSLFLYFSFILFWLRSISRARFFFSHFRDCLFIFELSFNTFIYIFVVKVTKTLANSTKQKICPIR